MNTERLKGIRQAKGYHVLPVKPGQQLEIHETVGQGGNLRTWKFRGLVLNVNKPNQPDGTFTIRGKIAGATIEKIYPLSFDNFEKVLLIDEYKIRRAKLYYLRDKVGKDTRMQSVIAGDQKGVDLLKLAKEAAEQEQKQRAAEHEQTEKQDEEKEKKEEQEVGKEEDEEQNEKEVKNENKEKDDDNEEEKKEDKDGEDEKTEKEDAEDDGDDEKEKKEEKDDKEEGKEDEEEEGSDEDKEKGDKDEAADDADQETDDDTKDESSDGQDDKKDA